MTDTEDNVEDISIDTKEGEEVEEEEEIYDSATFISGPRGSENCTINMNILEFEYPFEYITLFEVTIFISVSIIFFFLITLP